MVGIKGINPFPNIKIKITLIRFKFFFFSWDEWVSCPRVLKCNEENLKKQAELLKTHG